MSRNPNRYGSGVRQGYRPRQPTPSRMAIMRECGIEIDCNAEYDRLTRGLQQTYEDERPVHNVYHGGIPAAPRENLQVWFDTEACANLSTFAAGLGHELPLFSGPGGTTLGQLRDAARDAARLADRNRQRQPMLNYTVQAQNADLALMEARVLAGLVPDREDTLLFLDSILRVDPALGPDQTSIVTAFASAAASDGPTIRSIVERFADDMRMSFARSLTQATSPPPPPSVADHPDAGKELKPARLRRSILGVEVTQVRGKFGGVEIRGESLQAITIKFNRRKK